MSYVMAGLKGWLVFLSLRCTDVRYSARLPPKFKFRRRPAPALQTSGLGLTYMISVSVMGLLRNRKLLTN